MSYRSFIDELSWPARIAFFIFQLVVCIGVLSFATFNTMLIVQHEKLMSLDGLLICVFAISLQILWGFAGYKVNKNGSFVKESILLIFPLAATSIPMGYLGYVELTKEPPPPVQVVY